MTSALGDDATLRSLDGPQVVLLSAASRLVGPLPAATHTKPLARQLSPLVPNWVANADVSSLSW